MTRRAIATAPGQPTKHVTLTGAQETAHTQAAADWAAGVAARARAEAAANLASTDAAMGAYAEELVALLEAKGLIAGSDLSQGLRDMIAARANLRRQA